MTENGLMDGTRTEKLFYNDSHLSKFTAMVLECEPYEKKEGCYAVELDRTAFFPEGGGQYADTGKLKDAKVSDVREKNGRILHITDQPFEAGEIVEGEIDWETRFMKMQQHTGEHIVSGIVHARYGFNNVGFHLGTEDCTMDFDGEISKEALQEIELEANRAVWKNLTIEVSYPSKEELEELDYRSKIEIEGQVRIVSVPGYDICACCAPHVERTGEIGMIKLVNMQRYKGGVRVTMLCGSRACELGHFIALDDGNDVWAEQILKACKENMPVRRSHAKEVAAAGFDSASEALRMQKYYLEAVEKETK